MNDFSETFKDSYGLEIWSWTAEEFTHKKEKYINSRNCTKLIIIRGDAMFNIIKKENYKN